MRTVDQTMLVTPEIREQMNFVHEYWSSKSLEDVMLQMPEPEYVDVDNRTVAAVVIPPRSNDVDETLTLVRLAEHQQAYTAGQYISAVVLRDMVAPNSNVVMLQNNSLKHDQHTVDASMKLDILKRGLAPIAEDKMRVLEKLNLGNVALTGWSMGARMAIEMLHAGSNTVQITHVNADEPPSKTGRNVVGLIGSFMGSGGYDEQLEAVAHSKLPALIEHFEPKALKKDYMKFGMYNFLPGNLAIMWAMRDSIVPTLVAAKEADSSVHIKLGMVEGSTIFEDGEAISPEIADVVHYSGLYRHATVNNPFAQALLAAQGINPTEK